MITVPQATKSIIESKPFLVELIGSNLINLTELARQVQPQVEKSMLKKVTISSIVMALKRMRKDFTPSLQKFETYAEQFGNITLISGLTEFTYINIKNKAKKQKALLEIVEDHDESFVTFNNGIHESTMIISNKLTDLVQEIYMEDTLVGKIDNLTGITIKLPPHSADVPGLYYFILKKLGWEGISIMEIVSTLNELTLFLQDKYVDRAFSIIKSIKA